MADTKKPNILVIFGDDIGTTSLSCYSFLPWCRRTEAELHFPGVVNCRARGGIVEYAPGRHGVHRRERRRERSEVCGV